MNSKEIVLNTLNFENPTRIPRDLWTLPWSENKYSSYLEKIKKKYPGDIAYVNPYYKNPPKMEGDKYEKGKYIDEWGCIFTNIKKGIHGEVREPLIEDWSEVDKVNIPEERLSINKSKINKFCKNTEKFVLPNIVQRPFERLQFIRGTENLFMDLIENTSEVNKLLGRIHEFYVEEIIQWCKTDIDGIFFMDDWGAQNNLLISPQKWRETFKPLYKEYVEIAHKYDKYAFMHSDGHIMGIIPDLIDINLDALNSQLFCMDIEKIGEKFSGKITFWGEIDRQQILSFGEKDDVNKAVKKVFDNLYLNGGVIAQCEFGPGAKPENVMQVFKSWQELSKENF